MTVHAPLPRLSLNDWSVLAVLVEEPRHGFAVARQLERDAPLGSIWRVARPQVYRSVDRLVAAGLAEVGSSEHGHGPDRRVVSPTSAGRRAVHKWATTPVDRLRKVRSDLLVRLAVCRRLGLDGLTLLDRQAEVIAAIQSRLDKDLALARDERRIALLWRRANAEAVESFLTTARGWWASRD
jgi:DNA-binding PadR family transcriptional regulator